MEIKASDVKALREKTGCGLMDCKKALTDANGDMAEAARILKEIRQIKAIDNEQVKFEIDITVEGMDEKTNTAHSHKSS